MSTIENPPSAHHALVSSNIPRYVRALNAQAEAAGIQVTVSIGPYDDDPELRIWSTWAGTKAQLRSLGFFHRTHDVRMMHRRCELRVPLGSRRGYGVDTVLAGSAEIDGEQVTWTIDGGPAHCDLEMLGEVEMMTSREGIVYHGTLDALAAAGIERRKLPVSKSGCKRSGYFCKEPQWMSRRLPDGTIRHWRESDEAFRARRREEESYDSHYGLKPTPEPPPKPTYMRLVVDNTRDAGEEAAMTALEIRQIVAATVEEVLARRPTPSAVTLKQAAEILGISRNTATKLNLPRNRAGLIPYEDVLEARAAH